MHKDQYPAEIRSAKREYHRNWRRNNPDKVQAAQMRFWQRKAQQKRDEYIYKPDEGGEYHAGTE